MAWGSGGHGSTPFGTQSVATDLSVSIAGTSTFTASIVDGKTGAPGVLHTLRASVVSHALNVAGVTHTLTDSEVTHFTR